LGRIENFTPSEQECALELIDIALKGTSADYKVLVALHDGKVCGYICYGPTPMTDGCYDLYWVAADPTVRGKGVGSGLLKAMEADLRERKGRIIRVETSAHELYGATRGFYEAMHYDEECRFKDFYRVGEDLVTLSKKL
jgi:GNAT superfamily N-acetyltransferase